jgi:hypothetical protein
LLILLSGRVASPIKKGLVKVENRLLAGLIDLDLKGAIY